MTHIEDRRPLPFPLPARADESLRGYVIRLAQEYVCRSTVMARWLCLTSMTRPSSERLVPMARMTGIAQRQLIEMGGVVAGSAHLVGHPIAPKFLHWTKLRMCPACLTDAPYHRQIWDLRLLMACPVHGVRLQDRCPDCGARFLWDRDLLVRCVCKADLRALPTSVADASELAVARLIHRRVGLATYDVGCIPREISEAPLTDLIALLVLLGRLRVAADRSQVEGRPPARSEALEARALGAGLGVVSDWPDGLRRLAEDVRAQRGGGNAMGLSARYGPLHALVRKSAHKEFGSLISATFREGGGEFRTFTDLRAELKLGRATLAKLRASPGWPLLGGPTVRGTTHLYRRSGAQRLQEWVRRRIGHREAAAALGLQRCRIDELVSAGMLTSLDVPAFGKLRGRSLDADEVVALRHRILGGATSELIQAPMRLRQLVASMSRHGVGLASVLRMLIAERVPYVVDPSPGAVFRRIVVDGRSLKAELLADLASGVAERGRVGLCAAEAAAILDLRAEYVRPLAEAGVLRRLGPADVRGRARYDETGVRAFWSCFITDVRIARRRKMRSITVRRLLADCGVEPVAIVGEGERTLRVYEKAVAAFIGHHPVKATAGRATASCLTSDRIGHDACKHLRLRAAPPLIPRCGRPSRPNLGWWPSPAGCPNAL